MQFLAESVILAFAGGIFGIAAGIGAVLLITTVAGLFPVIPVQKFGLAVSRFRIGVKALLGLLSEEIFVDIFFQEGRVGTGLRVVQLVCPIFNVADYGIVENLETFIPILLEEFRHFSASS